MITVPETTCNEMNEHFVKIEEKLRVAEKSQDTLFLIF